MDEENSNQTTKTTVKKRRRVFLLLCLAFLLVVIATEMVMVITFLFEIITIHNDPRNEHEHIFDSFITDGSYIGCSKCHKSEYSEFICSKCHKSSGEIFKQEHPCFKSGIGKFYYYGGMRSRVDEHKIVDEHKMRSPAVDTGGIW